MMWDTQADAEESFRKKAIWGAAIVVVLGAVGAGVYYKFRARPAEVPQVESRPIPPPAPTVSEPAIQNPIPASVQAEPKPLPALNDSDPAVRDSLIGLLGSRPVEQLLIPENIVRHIVVTLDNLPRKKVAVELRPVKSTAGTTAVASQGDLTTLGAANYERYAPFMRVVQSTDMKALADLYFRLYPLFQQAYEDLGYPGQYFNDRLVQVIDDLLATPQVQGPIELQQPKVFFEYADPKLEALSAGQKLLIRMGPTNAATLKVKLRELRGLVAGRRDPHS